MYNLIGVDELSHRSKNRIKILGEVFTPEVYVEDMLNLLYKDNKSIWFDENVIFFEPSCGHGNIVIQIYKKRLEAIYKKSLSMGVRKATFHAIANAINTLWAIDIDPNNVTHCQSRVIKATFEFLKKKLGIENEYKIIQQEQDFIAHLLCAIKWCIHENETLSALSDSDTAEKNATKTKLGGKWFKKHGHKPINYELCWIKYFNNCLTKNSIPIIYKRAINFVNKILADKLNGFDEFEFAKDLFEQSKLTSGIRKGNSKIQLRQL
ncbi:MAG: hypothetical protein ABSA84_03755 [Gammaproteobacteria bacterium]